MFVGLTPIDSSTQHDRWDHQNGIPFEEVIQFIKTSDGLCEVYVSKRDPISPMSLSQIGVRSVSIGLIFDHGRYCRWGIGPLEEEAVVSRAKSGDFWPLEDYLFCKSIECLFGSNLKASNGLVGRHVDEIAAVMELISRI